MSQHWPRTNAGAIARLVPTMLPTMTSSPSRARLGGHQQAFGEAAAFVELDVDDIEAADRAGNIVQRQHAFVAGDRDGAI